MGTAGGMFGYPNPFITPMFNGNNPAMGASPKTIAPPFFQDHSDSSCFLCQRLVSQLDYGPDVMEHKRRWCGDPFTETTDGIAPILNPESIASTQRWGWRGNIIRGGYELPIPNSRWSRDTGQGTAQGLDNAAGSSLGHALPRHIP